MNEEIEKIEEVKDDLSEEERKERAKHRFSIVLAAIDALLVAVIIYEVVSMFI